ncbi:hypothetical protein CDIK_0689 [Cucumispora dikerogammari]|nr:hypothetical protein CDIK_0689 [Cucumispora dikerogammari]
MSNTLKDISNIEISTNKNKTTDFEAEGNNKLQILDSNSASSLMIDIPKKNKGINNFSSFTDDNIHSTDNKNNRNIEFTASFFEDSLSDSLNETASKLIDFHYIKIEKEDSVNINNNSKNTSSLFSNLNSNNSIFTNINNIEKSFSDKQLDILCAINTKRNRSYNNVKIRYKPYTEFINRDYSVMRASTTLDTLLGPTKSEETQANTVASFKKNQVTDTLSEKNSGKNAGDKTSTTSTSIYKRKKVVFKDKVNLSPHNIIDPEGNTAIKGILIKREQPCLPDISDDSLFYNIHRNKTMSNNKNKKKSTVIVKCVPLYHTSTIEHELSNFEYYNREEDE